MTSPRGRHLRGIEETVKSRGKGSESRGKGSGRSKERQGRTPGCHWTGCQAIESRSRLQRSFSTPLVAEPPKTIIASLETTRVENTCREQRGTGLKGQQAETVVETRGEAAAAVDVQGDDKSVALFDDKVSPSHPMATAAWSDRAEGQAAGCHGGG